MQYFCLSLYEKPHKHFKKHQKEAKDASRMMEWGLWQILPAKSNIQLGEKQKNNCQKQSSQMTGNWLKAYNKWRNIFSGKSTEPVYEHQKSVALFPGPARITLPPPQVKSV